MTRWEYARLEFQPTTQWYIDGRWTRRSPRDAPKGTEMRSVFVATFHDGSGTTTLGVAESFNDVQYLNRAGAEGWEAYSRRTVALSQPARIHSVSYDMKRPVT